MAEASANLESATAEALSKDRMVSATVNARGEIADLKFHTDKYRSMAPAELAAAVKDVVERARRDVARQVSDALGDLAPGDSAARAQAVAGDPSALLQELGLGPMGPPR
ncbi:YbaB/EbfC family nucleoid-associated protein [Nocardiopsis kunsanensis]|uniref:YbaB/EbfC family nucleoid-associated protein n=1 Tax=Nocardiopsis kunsanensis TaxID=141693 RepID=UPI001EF9CAB5|nr:YbaB/EbfC family nucleoid-associated protein [Nocardiopsis kunsanensis]